jgi:diguanylate cyclase (GGDEF)-like protein
MAAFLFMDVQSRQVRPILPLFAAFLSLALPERHARMPERRALHQASPSPSPTSHSFLQPWARTADEKTGMEAGALNRHRRTLRDLLRVPDEEATTMARYQALLYGAGALLGAITVLLPHPATFEDSALLSNIVLAAVAGTLMLGLASRFPAWSLQLTLAFGVVVVTRAVYFSHEANSYYSFFYLWVALYAFYFFGRIWGLVQMAWVAVTYGWVLAAIDAETPVSRWLMTVLSLTFAGLLMDSLARRLREREAEASSRAGALAAIDTIAHELALRSTGESAGPAICEAAAEVAKASGANLIEPTSDGTGLEIVAATDSNVIGGVMLLTGKPSGAIRAFNTRKPFFVANASEEEDVDQDLITRLDVASVLFQPIMREGSPLGVLTVYWREPLAKIDEETRQVMTLLAAEASIAIERADLLARLERAARTDDLTGLPNRRAWDEHISREVARAKRLGTELCVAMLDLDHFKEYNDRLGHQAGDRFLKETAAAWQSHTRHADFISRYGGEEFAIALVDCELEEATEALELLRAITPEGASSSAGVVHWDGSETEAELVARADAALYEAKRGGRDRVVRA